MTSLLLPDVNVWLALSYGRHAHHDVVQRWYDALNDQARMVFCRQTQMGLIRLLTTPAVLQQDALSQRDCWQIFDEWASTGQVEFAEEPPGIDSHLRRRTMGESSSPKVWMDAYLAAFAEAGGMQLVTFDRALAAKSSGAILLC